MIQIRKIYVFLILLFCSAAGLWGLTVTWEGDVSTDWSIDANWDTGNAPTSGDDVIIPTGLTNYPKLTSNITITGADTDPTNPGGESGTIHILNGGELDLNGFDIDGNPYFENDGLLKAKGGENIGTNTTYLYGAANPDDYIGNTVEYTGIGDGPSLGGLIAGINNYHNLTISGGILGAGTEELSVKGTLTISNGSLNIASLNSNLTPNNSIFTMTGGTLTLEDGIVDSSNLTGGTIEFTGTGIPDITEFHNLTIGTGADYTFANADITLNDLTVNGTLNLSNREITANGKVDIATASTLTAAGSTLILSGTSGGLTLTSGGKTFGDVTVSAGADYAFADDTALNNLTVYGTLDISGREVTADGTVTITNANPGTDTDPQVTADNGTIIADSFYHTYGTIDATGTLTLTISNSAYQAVTAGAIIADALILNGAGSYTLVNTANAVDSISTGTVSPGTGEINFTNNSSLTIGDGINGITTDNANITLKADGFTFAVNSSINAGTAQIELDTNSNSFTAGASVVNLEAATVKINSGTATLSADGSVFSANVNTLILTGLVTGLSGTFAMANMGISSTGTAALSLTLGANVSKIAVHHYGNVLITKTDTSDLAIADLETYLTGLIGIKVLTVSGIVTLNTAGAVNQEPNAIVTTNDLVLNGTGSYALTQSNAISFISTGGRATNGGAVNFTNNGEFTVGDGANGIFTNNADVTLNVYSMNELVPVDRIILANNITTNGGAITFSDNVILGSTITIDSSDGTNHGNITFSGTVNGNQNLIINNGNGTVTFTGAVGSGGAGNVIGTGTGTSLSITGDGLTSFEAALTTANGIDIDGPVIFKNNVVVNGTSDTTFGNTVNFDASGDIPFTSAGKITFNGDVSSNHNLTIQATEIDLTGKEIAATGDKNITLIIDSLLNAGSINAGNGTFTMSPSTSAKTIEYGDINNISIVTDVYYSSAWDSVTALSFTVGGTSQNDDIYLSGVSDAPFELSVQTNGAIHVAGNYTSQNHKVNLSASTITFPNTLGASRTINLGTAAFSANHPVALNNIDDVTIAASGGISFSDVISASGSAANNLTLNAGTGGNIIIEGTVGSGTTSIGKLLITSSATTQFNKDVFAGEIDITAGTQITINPSDNSQLTLNSNNLPLTLNSPSVESIGTGRSLTLNSGTGAGNINIVGNISLSGLLTFSAGDGNININGTISITGLLSINNLNTPSTFIVSGNSISAAGGISQTGTGTNIIYGDISTTNNNSNISFDGPITNGGFNTRTINIDAGTGNITLANIGAATPSGFNNITISGGAINLKGNVYSEHNVTVTNSGTLTVASAAGIYAQEVFTASGSVTNNGTIQAGPVADGANAIVFNGNYKGENSGEITGSSSTNPNIIFKGNVTFNNSGIVLNGDVIKFEGTAAAQTFIPTENFFEGKIVINNVNGVTLTGSKGAQNGELAIYNGTLTINPSSAWLMDASAASLFSTTGFSGESGTLAFEPAVNQAASLTTPSFSTSSGFRIEAEETGGTKTVSSLGNVTIESGTLGNPENVDFEITAAAQLMAGKQIGNLVINNGIVTLGSALSVKHDVIIKSGALDVSSNNHKITVGRHWRQHLGSTPFNPRQGTVEFTGVNGVDTTGAWTGTRKAIFIQGSTTWWNFVCNTAQPIIIKFARNNHNTDNNITHTFLNPDPGGFTVKTTASGTAPNDRTILTRMNDTDYDASIFTAPSGGNGVPPSTNLEFNRYYFWNIQAKTASLDFDNVTVNYSWADPDSIQLLHTRFDDVDAIPHLGNPLGDIYEKQNHYCVGWTEGIEFIYSYTEDENHNGRIDRIRVQASTVFNGTFDDSFKVEVDGYKVLGLPGRVPLRNDMFYIYLEEMPYADAGNTLTWRLLNNDAITEAETGLDYEFMTFRREDMKTIDTTWPVVSYSLMLPKNTGDTSASQQLFIQFSEPVTEPDINLPFVPQSITALSPFTAFSPLTNNSNTYAKEYIVEFAPANEITIHEMVNELRYTINNPDDVLDYKGAINPADQSIPSNPGPDYPYPLFPIDKNYSSYTIQYKHASLLDTYDTTTPEYDFRITDILISIPPADSADKRYFAWPFLGRDEMGYLGSFQLPGEIDLVAIRKFDGSGTLRDSEITLDVYTHDDFQSPDLIIGVDVPLSLRASIRNGSEGLWLPYDSGLVPKHIWPIIQYAPNLVSSNNLSSYTINTNGNDFTDDDVIDFYFQKIPGLSAGRLDIAPGADIPPDWYRRIKPFSFNINEMTYQRGGATILNNVINPTTGEKVYLNSFLRKSGQVTVQVFTLDGTLVQVLYRGRRGAGEYVDSWDGRNRGGNIVARGMYFIRIVGPEIDEIRKVMVVK